MLALSLMVGAGTAQLPEYTQQYVQRLGGAVDALSQVVADFDASAANAGLTRQDALGQMTGTDFLDARQKDMRRTFERHAHLSDQLNALADAPASTRALAIIRAPDAEVARAAYSAFRPALPVTSDGLMFGGGGFLVALVAFTGFGRLFRSRRPA